MKPVEDLASHSLVWWDTRIACSIGSTVISVPDGAVTTSGRLREHLKTIVEWELGVSRDDLNDPESYQLYVDQYDDIKSNLREAVATERLTVDQHRYINDVIGVLKACQDRLKGDNSGLLSYLEPETGSLRPSVSLSVSSEPEVPEPKALTLASLIEQYEQENAQNWKPATLSENRASHSTLIEIFDYLDIQDVGKATRADMLRVREVLQQLPKNRKQRFKSMPLSDLLNRESKTDCLDVVTINNKYLIKMAAVFKWAVRNDLIAKNLTEGLELKVPQRKASDARDAFSPEQVFDGLKLMKNGYGEQVSKWFNRTLLPKVLADRSGLAFHSFRHTVATQLKQHGVELAYAQAIMGHSSGSITYDRYAKEVEVDRLVNVMAGVYKETGLNG